MVSFCFRLYNKTAVDSYGSQDTDVSTMVRNATAVAAKLAEKGVTSTQESLDGDFVVTAVTPLMRRAHKLKYVHGFFCIQNPLVFFAQVDMHIIYYRSITVPATAHQRCNSNCITFNCYIPANHWFYSFNNIPNATVA
jgi:hypothetical protein